MSKPICAIKIFAGGAALLALCLSSLQGCRKTDDAELTTVVTVQAEHPETGEIAEHILADAVLSPLAQASISPRITAPVKIFYVQRGSKVKQGQLLAVLENRDLSAQVLDNKGQYEAAEAAYAIQTKAQAPEDYHKAELDVAQAKAQLQLQQDIVAARKRLLDQGAIAGRDYDTAAAALVQFRAAYDVAANHLAGLERVSRQATLQQSQGQLASAKGKYLAAGSQLAYSEIRSPISGVVTDRPLYAGETAAPGGVLITVMNTSALIAKVHLAQTVAQRISVGDLVTATVPGTDAPVQGKISLVSPALDPGSLTVEVWVRIDNKDGRYKAGTPVRISITGRAIPNAIKVPASAVLATQDGTRSVMIIGPNGTAQKKTVETGITDGEDVQISSGLTGRETVITVGAYGLDEGTRVKAGKPDDDDKNAKPEAGKPAGEGK